MIFAVYLGNNAGMAERGVEEGLATLAGGSAKEAMAEVTAVKDTLHCHTCTATESPNEEALHQYKLFVTSTDCLLWRQRLQRFPVTGSCSLQQRHA